MKLIVTERYRRAYAKLPDGIKTQVKAALKQFYADPRHPSLHFEKLSGSKYRTIRVDRKMYRIVLRGDGGTMELVDVDRHDKVDSKYG